MSICTSNPENWSSINDLYKLGKNTLILIEGVIFFQSTLNV